MRIDDTKKLSSSGNSRRFAIISIVISPVFRLVSIYKRVMYNGVGISTPRGSGSSGHVQANNFRQRQNNARYNSWNNNKSSNSRDGDRKEKKPNEEILQHNNRRQIEVRDAIFMTLLFSFSKCL